MKLYNINYTQAQQEYDLTDYYHERDVFSLLQELLDEGDLERFELKLIDEGDLDDSELLQEEE